MKKLRAAVIGVGYLGNFHAQKYQKLSQEKYLGQVELIGVCDQRAEQAAKIGLALGVPAFGTPKELVGRVDLVTIASNTPTHHELAKQFLMAGVHVNVEKPMCLTSQECAELSVLARERGLVLAVGHSERFSPAFARWRAQQASFETMEFERHAPYNPRGADVSVVHDLMVHDLDLALSLAPEDFPEVVSAKFGKAISPTWDWAQCLLRWRSGRTAWISSSRLSPQMVRRARGLGTAGMHTVDFQNGVYEHARRVDGEWKTETENIGKSDNLLVETDQFIGAVLRLAPHEVTGEAGERSLRLIENIERWVVERGNSGR